MRNSQKQISEGRKAGNQQNNRASRARNLFGKYYLGDSNSSPEAAGCASLLPTNNTLGVEIPAAYVFLAYQCFIFSKLFLPYVWLPKPTHVLIGMLWNMETIKNHILGHRNDFLQNQWTTQNLRGFGKKDGNCGIKPTNSISCHSAFYKALNWSVCFRQRSYFTFKISGFWPYILFYFFMYLHEIQETFNIHIFSLGLKTDCIYHTNNLRAETLSRPHLRGSNYIGKTKNLSFQMASWSPKSYLTCVRPSLAIQT